MSYGVKNYPCSSDYYIGRGDFFSVVVLYFVQAQMYVIDFLFQNWNIFIRFPSVTKLLPNDAFFKFGYFYQKSVDQIF